MVDPPSSPKSNAPSFLISLADHNSNPIVPDAFFATHLEGKNELTNLKLTSDACDSIWQVKLDGPRFADGWEDFSNAHCLRDDDVLIFRDHGYMIFHVTPSGRNFSQILCLSSSSDDSDDDDDDDESESEDEDNHDDDDETWDRNSSLKKRSRLEAGSGSSEHSCIIGVTSSNLRLNIVNLSKSFTIANGLHKSWCEIDLMNQSGKSWVMRLRHNKSNGQDFMGRGWTSFCHGNKLKTGCFYRFELVLTGTRPALKLCSDNTPQRNCLKAKVSAKPNKEGERSSMNRTVTLTKILKASRDQEETETRFQKKARVSAREPSRRTQAPHKPTVDPESLQCKQPLKTIFHQVRQSIVDGLADVRRFRSELEIKEQNLEAVLQEVDMLGEKVSDINKFFK